MKNHSTLFSFFMILLFTAFCVTAHAQYDNPAKPLLYNDENSYEEDDQQQYPDEEPIMNEDDLQPGLEAPGYENPDNELQKILENEDEELPEPVEDSKEDEGLKIQPDDDIMPTDLIPGNDAQDVSPPDTTSLEQSADIIDEADEVETAAPSSVAPSLQTVSTQCDETAAGHVVFLLYNSGISSGISYLKPAARVDFSDQANMTHQVRIVPSGFFNSNAFTVTPGSKVLTHASNPIEITVGKILVNTGNRQSKHFVVICP